MSNAIKNGDTVTVHYTGTTTDGTVFDSSKEDGREALTVVLGEGQLIPGFEAGIIGNTACQKHKTWNDIYSLWVIIIYRLLNLHMIIIYMLFESTGHVFKCGHNLLFMMFYVLLQFT
jgi:hypothetical protein